MSYGYIKPDGTTVSNLPHSVTRVLQDWIKTNWTLVAPVGINNIKWGQWFSGYGDITLKCIEGPTSCDPGALGGSEELDSTIIYIHIFYRSLQSIDGEEIPDNLQKIRNYITGMINAGKLAFYFDYGITQYIDGNDITLEDLPGFANKLHHLVIIVRWDYNIGLPPQ